MCLHQTEVLSDGCLTLVELGVVAVELVNAFVSSD